MLTALAMQTRVDERRTILIVGGELDLDTAAELRGEVRRILDTNPRELHLDLSTVPFVDSTGLGALVGAAKAAAAVGVPLRVEPSERVRMLLSRTGLLGWFGLTA